MEENKHKEIDELLNGILKPDTKANYYHVNELFDQRLTYLGITKHQSLKILGIDHKTLDAFLAGDAKKIDFVTILKIADFLEIPHNNIVEKYFSLVAANFSESLSTSKKRSFIVNNFNLPALKKIGFIDSINDFDHIESRINNYFGYENIFEYSKYKINAAFSSGKRTTNKENLTFWYASACESLEKTPNPYEYDRQALIDYFPQIRWHSLNVENGLMLVAQALYKIGVTLIVIPKFTPDIHVRGATLPYRDKPCIVLTKYTDFYASLWFALIHELFHVLYDWDEIQKEQYHISGETNSAKISEEQANDFARQYLFSTEKMMAVQPHINNHNYVKIFGQQNHVHDSIIYSFFCWEQHEEKYYAKFKKYMSIDFSELLEKFNADSFLKFVPVKEISKARNINLYNSI